MFLKVPNVLFLENGVNRAFGESSWEAVISGLSTGEFDSSQKWMREIHTLPFGFYTELKANGNKR